MTAPSRSPSSRPRSTGRLVAIGAIALLTFSACAGPPEPRSRAGDPAATTTTRPGPDLSNVDFGDAPTEGGIPSITEYFTETVGDLSGEIAGLDPATLAALGVGTSVVEVLGLVDEVAGSSYSVGYRVSGEMVAEVPGEPAVSNVYTPSRQKYSFSIGSDAAYQAIVDGDTMIECQLALEWSCTRAASAATEGFGAHDLLYVLGIIAENPGAYDISEYRTTIVGVPVRCIRGEAAPVAGVEDLIEVCITGEGVPLQVRGPGIALDGVWYVPDADPAQFDLPAPVT